MNRKVEDLVPEFVREAFAESALTESELRKVTEVATLLGRVGMSEPRPSGISRLMGAALDGSMRYAPFFDKLAALFDLGVDEVARIMTRSLSDAAWVPGPSPGVRLFHLEGGPAVAAADVGLVRMDAGLVWPHHRHHGVERALILEGGYRESTGRVFVAGDLHEMQATTEHDFKVLDERPLLLAVVLTGKIEFRGSKGAPLDW
jgi:putative transcriptional regulator